MPGRDANRKLLDDMNLGNHRMHDIDETPAPHPSNQKHHPETQNSGIDQQHLLIDTMPFCQIGCQSVMQGVALVFFPDTLNFIDEPGRFCQ